jgi:hypothetical protein
MRKQKYRGPKPQKLSKKYGLVDRQFAAIRRASKIGVYLLFEGKGTGEHWVFYHRKSGVNLGTWYLVSERGLFGQLGESMSEDGAFKAAESRIKETVEK